MDIPLLKLNGTYINARQKVAVVQLARYPPTAAAAAADEQPFMRDLLMLCPNFIFGHATKDCYAFFRGGIQMQHIIALWDHMRTRRMAYTIRFAFVWKGSKRAVERFMQEQSLATLWSMRQEIQRSGGVLQTILEGFRSLKPPPSLLGFMERRVQLLTSQGGGDDDAMGDDDPEPGRPAPSQSPPLAPQQVREVQLNMQWDSEDRLITERSMAMVREGAVRNKLFADAFFAAEHQRKIAGLRAIYDRQNQHLKHKEYFTACCGGRKMPMEQRMALNERALERDVAAFLLLEQKRHRAETMRMAYTHQLREAVVLREGRCYSLGQPSSPPGLSAADISMEGFVARVVQGESPRAMQEALMRAELYRADEALLQGAQAERALTQAWRADVLRRLPELRPEELQAALKRGADERMARAEQRWHAQHGAMRSAMDRVTGLVQLAEMWEDSCIEQHGIGFQHALPVLALTSPMPTTAHLDAFVESRRKAHEKPPFHAEQLASLGESGKEFVRWAESACAETSAAFF